MKMFAKVQGIKRAKGVMNDTGRSYDSTTLFIEIPFGRSDDMRGSSTQPMKFGTSENYKLFEGIPLPFDAEIDVEVETNGKTVQNVITLVVPIKPSKPEQPK